MGIASYHWSISVRISFSVIIQNVDTAYVASL
jgi:hypothetical protein